MKLLFLGTRGWYPKYGQTACVLVQTKKADFVFDCGTGAAELLDTLRQGAGGVETHVLLSHFHLDHIVGLSFLLGVFRGRKLTIWGQKGVEKVVRHLLSPPYFPVPVERWPFKVEFGELAAGERVRIADAEVLGQPLVHSDPDIGFRLEAGGRAIAYVTDTKGCENAVRLARGADVLIHEAMYSEKNKVGTSHSTGVDAGKIARLAGVRKLVLFHLDAEGGPAVLREILAEAKKEFKQSILAKDGMCLKI